MSWKKKLELLDNDNFDIDRELESSLKVRGKKVAMTNGTPAYIGIDEQANVDIMSSHNLGIKMDNETGTMLIVGKKLSMIFEEIDMYSLPFQWRHNKFTINTLPAYPPGMGMILPDAPTNIARGLGDIARKIKNIIGSS